MVEKITIGPLKIPALWVFGVRIWPEITLLPEITVFDPDWILEFLMEKSEWFSNAVSGVIDGIIDSLFNTIKGMFEALFDSWARDFYERRGEEKG